MGVLVDKLVGELPNMANHVLNTKWRITLWAVLGDFFWGEDVNIRTIIYS